MPMAILSRAHQDADGRRSRAVSCGVLVKSVCAVDAEQRGDGGGPDVEDLGVRYFTVDLHHHLKLFISYDALIYVHCWQHQRHLGSTSFIVAGGRK